MLRSPTSAEAATNARRAALRDGIAMALPYFLLRLVDDFSGVPARVLRGAEVVLTAFIIAFAAMLKLENGASSNVTEEIDPNLALAV